MPSKYAKTTLSNDGAAVYDALVNANPTLKARLPLSTKKGITSNMIGDMLYTDQDLSNAFIPALLNQIALRVVQSKYWIDPWVGLEKGKLNYGEIINEIFIKMAKPHEFDQARAEQEVFKREIPDVLTAFHSLNYKKFYKQSISNEELRGAFISWDSLTRFIADIIQNMFTSANYDINQTKRYMLGYALIHGFAGVQVIKAITDKASAEDAVAAARTASLDMLEMSPNYNRFKVPNFTSLEDQVIIINNKVAGRIDVSVLAADFNMDKAEFLTMHRLAVSSFGNLDTARLAELYAEDPTYEELSAEELAELDQVAFIIVDRNWFQIYDYFNGVTNIFNPDGVYWNYDYQVWKVFGSSPFSNIQAFSSVAQEITGISVTPSAVTVSVGQTAQLTANVSATGFADRSVTWTSDTEGVTVNSQGKVTVVNATAGTTATITAMSNFDNTKTATCTVTVG